jgi:hypothetical protein
VECGHASVEAARFNLATGDWSVVASPKSVSPPGSVFVVARKGSSDSHAYFSVGTADANVLVEYDVDADAWRRVPDAPTIKRTEISRGEVGEVGGYCTVDGALFAAQADGTTNTLHSTRWDVRASAWVGVPDVTLPADAVLDQTACWKDSFVHLSYSRVGVTGPMLWLDGTDRTWARVPAPPVRRRFDARLSAAEANGARVYWPGSNDEDPNVYVLPRGSKRWRATPSPLQSPVQLLEVDGAVIAGSLPDRISVPKFVVVGT